MSEPRDALAGRGRRLLATLIDAILVPALTVVLVAITGVVEHAEDYRNSLWMLNVLALAVVSYLLLNGYLLGRRAQTLGKAALGITMVSVKTGERSPFWRLVCLRALFFAALFLIVAPPLLAVPLIDQLFIFSKSRRCLHDYVAGTRVVRRGSPTQSVAGTRVIRK